MAMLKEKGVEGAAAPAAAVVVVLKLWPPNREGVDAEEEDKEVEKEKLGAPPDPSEDSTELSTFWPKLKVTPEATEVEVEDVEVSLLKLNRDGAAVPPLLPLEVAVEVRLLASCNPPAFTPSASLLASGAGGPVAVAPAPPAPAPPYFFSMLPRCRS